MGKGAGLRLDGHPQQFRALFDSPPSHGDPEGPQEGAILALEPFVHPGCLPGENAFWDKCAEGFSCALEQGLAGGIMEACSCDECFNLAAEDFSQECVPERGALYAPSLIETMLMRGSDLVQDGWIPLEEISHPVFPLCKASDVILSEGYGYSALMALDANRGVVAFNAIARRANALPEEARARFLKDKEPIGFARAMKQDLQLERDGCLDGWAAAWTAEIRRACGLPALEAS